MSMEAIEKVTQAEIEVRERKAAAESFYENLYREVSTFDVSGKELLRKQLEET